MAQTTLTMDFSGIDCDTVNKFETFHLKMSNTLSVEMPLEIHEYEPVCEYDRTFDVTGAQHVYKLITPKGPIQGKGDALTVHTYFLDENERKLTEKAKATQGEPLKFCMEVANYKEKDSIWTRLSSTNCNWFHTTRRRTC